MDYNFPIISVKYGRKKGNKKRYTTTSYQETQIKTTTRCPPERLNLKKKKCRKYKCGQGRATGNHTLFQAYIGTVS